MKSMHYTLMRYRYTKLRISKQSATCERKNMGNIESAGEVYIDNYFVLACDLLSSFACFNSLLGKVQCLSPRQNSHKHLEQSIKPHTTWSLERCVILQQTKSSTTDACTNRRKTRSVAFQVLLQQ